MTDSNDVQALESISNAVDDSQLKIILTTQCIKAQSLLVTKLRKQSEHQKEICNFINNGNVKLKAEIRIAEQKMKSTITALETIKSANVELQKELFLSKERSSDIVQRVDNGIKKYEKLWQEAKAKYENIPFIKHYLETKNLNHTVKQNIDTLINDSHKLTNDIIAKKNKLADLDRSRIIGLANYLIIERPNTLLLIKQKRDKIDEINKKISKVINNPNDRVVHNINISKDVEKSVEKEDKDENSGLDLNKSAEDMGMVLPKLELCYIDLDLLSNKLDKIKKSDSFSIPSTRIQNQIELQQNTKINDSHDDFEMILIGDNFNTHKNYSDKKLINILDDVKINDTEAKDILSKVKQSDLRDVSVTEVIVASNKDDEMAAKVGETAEVRINVEEIDSTPQKPTVIGPPSQFLDLTESSQKSDIILVDENPTQNSAEINNSKKTDEGNILDESKDTDNSRENDASFEKIKDSILKKHNFDLSPQFVYSKKPMTTTKSEDVVTSKFFDGKNSRIEEDIQRGNSCNVDSPCHEPMPVEDTGEEEVNGAAQISEKLNGNNLEHKNDMPTSGFLFKHGADGIIQLSNTSLDTTGYGDGENDFPSCIDSSLLLSPKADLEIQSTGPNDEPVLSQEVPNFLTGLRKTGFSFFGSGTTHEASTSETGTKPLQSNFNFNFGSEQKKTRGGLFSMFR